MHLSERVAGCVCGGGGVALVVGARVNPLGLGLTSGKPEIYINRQRYIDTEIDRHHLQDDGHFLFLGAVEGGAYR